MNRGIITQLSTPALAIEVQAHAARPIAIDRKSRIRAARTIIRQPAQGRTTGNHTIRQRIRQTRMRAAIAQAAGLYRRRTSLTIMRPRRQTLRTLKNDGDFGIIDLAFTILRLLTMLK